MGALGVAAGFAWGVSPVPWALVAFGRETPSLLPQTVPGIVKNVPTEPGDRDIYCIYVGEGTNYSVAVTQTPEGVRSFHGAGKIQASTLNADMRLQRMLGHIPALLHPKPESVLVVACGAGVTAGSFLVHPEVQRVVICDIEPLVPKVVVPMFGTENYHVVDGIDRENPHDVNGKQVEVVYDDGRHFLRTTKEKFDIITSDPIDPWVKGCAALNTVEYYQMCRDHLKPGGTVCLWIPLYEGNLETTKSVLATFFQVFPNGIIWSNERDGFGYDAILFGQVEPTVIDVDALQRRLDRPDHKLAKQSLRDVDFGELQPVPDGFAIRHEGMALLATYAGQAPLLKEWSRGRSDQHRPQLAAAISGRDVVELQHARPPSSPAFSGITGSPTKCSLALRKRSKRSRKPSRGRAGKSSTTMPENLDDFFGDKLAFCMLCSVLNFSQNEKTEMRTGMFLSKQ